MAFQAEANAGAWTSLVTDKGKPIPLHASLLANIHAQGFDQMTPVQAATVPLFLNHKDVAVEAVTGSGKTLAFVVPVIELLLRSPPRSRQHIGAVIISPTRELAAQTERVVRELLGDAAPLSVLLLTGGGSVAEDVEALRTNGGNILVATPGRLRELLGSRVEFSGHAKALEVLVLDEADRLLQAGFHMALSEILGFFPKQRRTGLFSATQTKEVRALVRAGLRNPVSVSVRVEAASGEAAAAQLGNVAQATPASLRIHYMICELKDKLNQLVTFLRQTQERRASKFIVYFCTCACVDYFYKVLLALKLPIPIMSLHGKVQAKIRVETIKKFREAGSAILLCTDVAARGLDIADINWVVQYDPPQDPAAFVHRCGRTARLGRQGDAVVFLAPHEDTYVNYLSVVKVPAVEMVGQAECHDHLADLRRLAGKDRELYERGKRAYVSYIRSYQEHQCSYIFVFKQLDLGLLATAFGLLHLPKMPELKSSRAGQHFEPSELDPDSIPYKDKTRERQRREKLARPKAPSEKKRRRVETTAWSRQKEKKIKSQKNKARKIFKAQQKRKQLEEQDDMDEGGLAKEARLAKKLRQGKITKDEFYAELGESDDEERAAAASP